MFYQGIPQGFVVLPSTDWNMVDMRMCLQGKETLIGIPWNVLPGAKASDKADAVLRMDAKTVMQYVKERGFMYQLAPNTMVCTPGDMVLIVVNWSATEAVHGVRWQIPGTAVCLKMAIQSLGKHVSETEGEAKAPLESMLAFLKRLNDEQIPGE